MNYVLFLHVLGAVAVGYYLLLPFVAPRLAKLEGGNQVGLAQGLYSFNRVGQWLLIVQFLTGGYLISKYDLSVAWMVVVIVLFIVLGAMAGMLGGPLKRIISAGGRQDAKKDISKVSAFSTIAAILLFVLLILMYLPRFGIWGLE